MSKTFLECLVKGHHQQPRADPEQGRFFTVAKADEEKHMIFGWASVAKLADGTTVEDYQRDVLDIGELESAVYAYVLNSRDGGEMHRRRGVGRVVESCVFTPEKQTAMGLTAGAVPEGWWLGLKIDDEDVWEKIKAGEYTMFSIEGTGRREPLDEEG